MRFSLTIRFDKSMVRAHRSFTVWETLITPSGSKIVPHKIEQFFVQLINEILDYETLEQVKSSLWQQVRYIPIIFLGNYK